MAQIYQIIEISVDADGNEGARRLCWSFDTLQEAINRIPTFYPAFDKKTGCWWCTAMNGERMHFVIDTA
jgi:hypothetical protein